MSEKEPQFIDELMKINNEQTNNFRMLLKENMVKQSDFEKKQFDQFDEIAKLNNELINSQRELAKKNQELKALNELLEKQGIYSKLWSNYEKASSWNLEKIEDKKGKNNE